ncbi:MAG: Omp85 family outer membrane protein [Syntrophothermus sp.]
MKSFPFLFFFILIAFQINAQDESVRTDTLKKEKIKKGWNFGALPIVGYDSDQGFQYGALANIYYYGDGSAYPQYFHSFYFEVSRFTKGGGINQFFFDSKKLIPGIRVTTDVSYLTEKALNFYGFNGYQSSYHTGWENQGDTSYRTRMFYHHERKLFRIGADFQGKLAGRWLNWFAGLAFLKFETGPVDTAKFNQGKSQDEKLPDVATLYDDYVSWGVLKEKEKNGGTNNIIKVGVVFDTRDNEPCPMQGIWTEALVGLAPGFLGDGKFSFAKLSVIHRQYFTLVKNDLSIGYRLAYQGTIAGKAPFYFQTYMLNTFSQSTTIDGLGGSETLRGILRNRVVGDGVAFGNIEMRWKFWHFRFIRQNFYASASAFTDAGMVVQKINIDKSGIPAEINTDEYFSSASEYPHVSAGAGLHLAMNQNFILTMEYGRAMDKRDGKDGFYVGLGYLF